MTDEPAPWNATVVIPAYNAAPWIAEAIASAALQQPAPVEILVVDDGSTDDTAAIAASMPGVRVVRRANGGEAAARNTGLEAARTRWVSFLDADDRFLPYRHRWIAARLAEQPELEVVAADALYVRDGTVIRTYLRHDDLGAREVQRRKILDSNLIVSHVACDRHRLLGLGGFDESLTQACDWDMWSRFLFDGGVIGLIDIPLSIYRRHETAMTADPVRVTRGDIAVWEKMLRHPALTTDERRRVETHIADARTRLPLEELKTGLIRKDADTRRRALAIARSADQSVRSRVKASTVVLAPELHRRLLLRRPQAL